jgi:cation diffusion facilitator family transporter
MVCCDCESTGQALAQSAAQRRVLWTVLCINLLIFVGEFGAGLWADSTALQGDSLDSLGDALVYALSLWVVGRSLRLRAGSALVKGGIQLLFAALVIAQVIRKLLVGAEPFPDVMAIAAGVALLANLTCLGLLTRFRSHDINMRSVWLCSRNDVVGNVGVLLTTALIAFTGWPWLDQVFGALLALLFARTGLDVLRAAWPQFHSTHPSAT